MKRPRDFQRSKLYRAEWAVVGEYKRLHHNADTMKLDEIKVFVNKILDSSWCKKNYEKAYNFGDVHIKDGRGTSIARGGVYWLNLPKWSRLKLIVLHELAHCIQGRVYGFRTNPWHGREFTSIFLALLKRWGKEHYEQMRISFYLHGVKYRKTNLK